MGNPQRLIKAFSTPSLISSPEDIAKRQYRKNLELTDPDDVDPEMAAWLAARQAKRDPLATADRMVDQHFEDAAKDETFPQATPEEAIGDVALSLGDPDATNRAVGRVYERLDQGGQTVRAPEGSITGRAFSVIPSTPMRSRTMGTPDGRVAVTLTRPQHLLNLLAGSPERGAEIAARQAARNDPFGLNGAVIYHSGNHEQALQKPWLIYRGLDGGFSEPGGTRGYASPLTQSVFFNAFRDYGNRASNHWRKPMNVGEHEAIHTFQDGQVPDKMFAINQKLLHTDDLGDPFIAPNPQPVILHTDFDRLPESELYTAMDAAEMHNLLTHAKRLTETTEPTMRDIGASRQSVDNFVDWMLNREGSKTDPIINMPGHHREGREAWGREELLDRASRIFKAADPKGQDAMRDSLFKTGDTSPLRTALLT